MATETLWGALGGGKTRENAYTESNRRNSPRGRGGNRQPWGGLAAWPGSWVTVTAHYWSEDIPAVDGWNIQASRPTLPRPTLTPDLAAWCRRPSKEGHGTLLPGLLPFPN